MNQSSLSGHGASLGIRTFCFGTDEAGGGAVEEVQDPSHSHTDVGVAGVKVQGRESLELEPDKFLWGHFEMRNLARRAKQHPDPEWWGDLKQDGWPRLGLSGSSFASHL